VCTILWIRLSDGHNQVGEDLATLGKVHDSEYTLAPLICQHYLLKYSGYKQRLIFFIRGFNSGLLARKKTKSLSVIVALLGKHQKHSGFRVLLMYICMTITGPSS
jgi:hypothetical protein